MDHTTTPTPGKTATKSRNNTSPRFSRRITRREWREMPLPPYEQRGCLVLLNRPDGSAKLLVTTCGERDAMVASGQWAWREQPRGKTRAVRASRKNRQASVNTAMAAATSESGRVGV